MNQLLQARKITQLRKVDADDKLKARASAALSTHRKALANMRLGADLDDRFEEIFMQQPDLMYVEAVLVSEGINDNDDAFTHEELWRAQGTPILKPINLQHNDRDVVGVMYGVEARRISDGAIMTEDDGSPFELIMHGVIWHYLPHVRGTALGLAERFTQGSAFVSMECWFEGYNYGLYDQSGDFQEEFERCDDTAFLEKHLRASGGSGRYNGKRVGRALTGITFGGVGIVDVPANRRSLLLDLFIFTNEVDEAIQASEKLASVATDVNNNDNVVRNIPEEGYMNDTTPKAVANAQSDVTKQVSEGVKVALESRDRAEAAQRAQAELDEARTEAAELRSELEATKTSLEATQTVVDQHFNALRAEAGATGDTPAEIAQIDSAIQAGGNGDSVMQAKIAWIANSRAAANSALIEELAATKAENEELRAKVREGERTGEIEALFANLLSDEEIAETVKRGLAKSDEDYAEWLEEKQLFAQKMMEQMKDDDKEKSKDKKKGKAGHVVRRDDGGERLQDNGVALQPGHGKVPGSVPNPKTLASADDISDLFEEVDELDPAGASAGADDDEAPSNPFEAMAAAMLAKPAKADRRAFGAIGNEGGN